MKIHKIHTNNADYQRLETLRTNRNKRHRNGLFLVEGVRNINEAISSGWEIAAFAYSYGRELSRWATSLLSSGIAATHYQLAPDLMDSLSGKNEPSEILAIARMRPEGEGFGSYDSNPVYILFDRPSNKGNLGTMLRSCDGLGAAGLIFYGHSVDIYDPEVIGASMGSFFKVSFTQPKSASDLEATLDMLKQRHPCLKIVATSANAEKALEAEDLTGPTLFLVGNESSGLSHYLYELADTLLTIPMDSASSASSLNVSCAATVLLYEASRQRRAKAQ